MEKPTLSFQAGIEAAKTGNNINNSHPFDHDEFVEGYKTIKPDAKTMLDECRTPAERLRMLGVMKMTEDATRKKGS